MRILLSIILFSVPLVTISQKLWHADIFASGNYTSNGQVPFWLRSDRFGSKLTEGATASAITSFRIDYDTAANKLFDWAVGGEARFNAGPESNIQLIEAYAKLKLSIFEFKAGRSKDIMGLVGDSLLSSGSFSISGNALGIPKVEISIPEFYAIPLWGGLFSFKGNFVHGWLGDIPIQYNIAGANSPSAETYFHQKSFYGRLGKPSWKFKLYAGFNHQAFWGNEKNAFGNNAKLSNLETYKYVVFGEIDQESKVGNHLGSIDIGFEYDFKNVRVKLYRQSLYDVGALYYTANIADGLNGVSFINTKEDRAAFTFNSMLFEFFYTKNQAGYPWSKATPSGDEDYYNNYIYSEGWSYKGEALGNPFITPKKYARSNLPNYVSDYFINNRVTAFHFGATGAFKQYRFITKLSYSKNYGTFGTSEYGHTTGSVTHTPTKQKFPSVNQFSSYLEVSKYLRNNFQISIAGAADAGKLYYNSTGIILGLKKTF